MSLVKLVDCSFAWDRLLPPLFSNVSFALQRGTWNIVKGVSGSGKSTLAMMCAGLLSPTNGTITFGGRPHPPTRSIQFLFQDPFAAIDPLLTVGQWFDKVVANKKLLHFGEVSEKQVSSRSNRVIALFERLGLTTNLFNSHPLDLSGGECQRVNLAAAISVSPQVLILDEPFTMVDEMARKIMLGILHEEVSQKHTALLLINHGGLPIEPREHLLIELSEGKVFSKIVRAY